MDSQKLQLILPGLYVFKCIYVDERRQEGVDGEPLHREKYLLGGRKVKPSRAVVCQGGVFRNHGFVQ